MRANGVLLPISSLPSRFGIGCFSESAYKFVDQIKNMGQSYWQILPLVITSFGDSPYQSFSTYAGNPYFISLEYLVEEGLLSFDDINLYDFGEDERYINYEKMYTSRYKILKKSFEKSDFYNDDEFIRFKKSSKWLDEFALFMALKDFFGGKPWYEWNENYKFRNEIYINKFIENNKEEIKFHMFIQFYFYKQWFKLKKYANEKNIKIIGDIPIYVSRDSVECWTNPELFQLDENRNPSFVAGCPPDAFSKNGQLWGNPIYDWDFHEKNNFDWWVERLSYCSKIYDVIRIDHFRGFDEYYSIPSENKTAEKGFWKKGPGLKLFEVLKKRLGKLDIIAEDLGFINENVKNLLKSTGFPGMKVLEFAFDSREDSDYYPHNYEKNCVVYTGTHDNDPIKGWFYSISEEDRELAKEYLNIDEKNINEIHWDFIRLAKSSVANLCIIPMQDYLGLGSESRLNIPSTIGINWRWRLIDSDINEDLILKIRKLVKIYARFKQ